MRLLTPLRRRGADIEKADPFDRWMREFFDAGVDLDKQPELRFLPAANVAETEKNWVVTMELPGLSEKDVEVRLSGNQLVVTGERKHDKESKDKQFHRIESSYGMFERRFELPENVRADGESVVAKFHKGMLEITVPKLEAKPVTKIAVQST